MVLLGVVSFMLVFSMMGCLVLDIAVVIVEPSKEYVAVEACLIKPCLRQSMLQKRTRDNSRR